MRVYKSDVKMVRKSGQFSAKILAPHKPLGKMIKLWLNLIGIKSDSTQAWPSSKTPCACWHIKNFHFNKKENVLEWTWKANLKFGLILLKQTWAWFD